MPGRAGQSRPRQATNASKQDKQARSNEHSRRTRFTQARPLQATPAHTNIDQSSLPGLGLAICAVLLPRRWRRSLLERVCSAAVLRVILGWRVVPGKAALGKPESQRTKASKYCIVTTVGISIQIDLWGFDWFVFGLACCCGLLLCWKLVTIVTARKTQQTTWHAEPTRKS